MRSIWVIMLPVMQGEDCDVPGKKEEDQVAAVKDADQWSRSPDPESSLQGTINQKEIELDRQLQLSQ